jgi:glucuronosyltransferase
MSPMDTAIYWTEYVIRHRGAPHMRTVGADLPLYKYLLLDVTAALVTAMITVVYVIYLMLKKLLIIIRSSVKNISQDKKEQ